MSAAAPVMHEVPIVEDIGALRHLQALHHVLLDQQDGDAVGVDARDQREQLLDQQRRKAERGLVEDQSFGSAIRPRPIASICCSPPDSVPARCARRSAKAREDREHALAVRARAARAARR